mgnify:CR=1 FL=1
MTELNLLGSPSIKKIHFIGIGGISMSGLAEILLNFGYEVSGSDIRSSSITKKLEKLGVKVFIGHSESNIQSPDLVVYTAAINQSNPELIKAHRLGIPAIDRAELLGQIMRKYKHSIAVAGTHGKTTTTSMISTTALKCNLDPTIHIGGELDAIGGTTRVGGNNCFIAEACEYCGSFLKFYPYIAVVLNIEYDHADYFKDISHIKDTFAKFISQVPENGYVVACADDSNILQILDGVYCNKVTFGLDPEKAMWSAANIVFDDRGCASFNLLFNKKDMGVIKMNVPGIHNVSNAVAAAATCHILGCNIDSIRLALSDFWGTHRRFELKGTSNDIKVIDDYAHHPTEIKATLKAAKNFRHSKVWCVFQPHTYSRTKSLLSDFSDSFNDADEIIITDIYAAREVDTGEISAKDLALRIRSSGKKVVYIKKFEDIVSYLEDKASPGDIIITMGAGDVYRIGEMFLENKKVMAVS